MLRRIFSLMVSLVVLIAIVPFVAGSPTDQGLPCFGGEGCPEPVNPEPDEYYTIQCATNAIWVWRSRPNPMFVTGIPFFEVLRMTAQVPLIAPLGVTLSRDGDTITLSGNNGNLAPQPGEKSFSWSECIEHNGGLPELPMGQELTDEQIACRHLPTEQEKVDCLNALESEPDTANTPTCDDPVYRSMHLNECTYVSCPLAPDIRVADLSECPDSLALLYEEINAILDFCLGPPVETGAVIVAVAAFRSRRKRK